MKGQGICIGIAGGSGSGKTAVSRAIYQDLGPEKVTIIEQDFYYRDLSHLPSEERKKFNFDHPDAFNTDVLLTHLSLLLEGKTVERPVYDYTTHSRKNQVVRVEPRNVIILEGILILADPRLRELMNIKVYIDTDADERFIRRLLRDLRERGRTVENIVEQYQRTVRPMHLQFVEPSKRYADIIIPEGGDNRVAVDLLRTKVQTLLSSSH